MDGEGERAVAHEQGKRAALYLSRVAQGAAPAHDPPSRLSKLEGVPMYTSALFGVPTLLLVPMVGAGSDLMFTLRALGVL